MSIESNINAVTKGEEDKVCRCTEKLGFETMIHLSACPIGRQQIRIGDEAMRRAKHPPS